MTTIAAIAFAWVVLAVLAGLFMGRLIALGEADRTERPRTSDQPDLVSELRALSRT